MKNETEILLDRVSMPDDRALFDLADLFKLFGDSTRVRILYLLLERETCVQDLASALGMTSSAVSHQLKILKAGKLVSSRRQGKTVFYLPADEHVRSILRQGMEHVLED